MAGAVKEIFVQNDYLGHVLLVCGDKYSMYTDLSYFYKYSEDTDLSYFLYFLLESFIPLVEGF